MTVISHKTIKEADEKAKAAKNAPSKPDYRHFLKRMNLASHGKNDDEVPEVVKEMIGIITEFCAAYPDAAPTDADAGDGK